MSDKDDGGGAFPSAWGTLSEGGFQVVTEGGLSVRDWFAGKAMLNTTIPTSGELKLVLAREAFAMADAMVEARKL